MKYSLLFCLYCLLSIHISCIFGLQIARKRLFDAIAQNQRIPSIESKSIVMQEIINIEKSIDSKQISTTCADGTWSLVFSTMTGDSTGNNQFVAKDNNGSVSSMTQALNFLSSAADPLFKFLYKQIFKIAPFLAGSQESVKLYDNSLIVTNQQKIDIRAGKVSNDVIITSKALRLKFEIQVNGNIEVVNAQTFDVTFTSCSLQGIKLPLPRPRGLLTNTFCDNELRISRGGKGGIFVLKRA
jgi:hypothetical protein